MVTTPNFEPDHAAPRGRWAAAWILLWTLAVVVTGIWLIDSSQRRTAQQLQQSADLQAERIRDRVESDLDLLRALPMVLAAQVNARSLLINGLRNPGETAWSDSLNAHYARIARMVDVDTVFLTDAEGDIVAGHSFSLANPQQMLGQNASDRAYFTMAKSGQAGEQFAIGRLSRNPSVFFSFPVIENEVFIGAVVVKASLDRMRRLLELGANPRALLIDSQQVVIAATDKGDYLRRVGTAAPLATANDRRYEDAEPDRDPIVFESRRSYGDVQSYVTTDGAGPYIKSTLVLNDDRWTICLTRSTQPIVAVTRQWRVALTLAWLVGALIIMLLIRSVRHVQDLDRLANIDVLSGLGNRRHYDSIIDSLCDAHDRGRVQHVALALFDLDHFKRVNDELGHAAGDRVIEQFAQRLSASTRRMDHLFRLGGDEFAALILELTPKAAEQAVLGIQARLQIAANDTEDLPQPGVSIGLAYHREGESPDALYRRADQAMYSAKNGGRNRLHVAKAD